MTQYSCVSCGELVPLYSPCRNSDGGWLHGSGEPGNIVSAYADPCLGHGLPKDQSCYMAPGADFVWYKSLTT